MILQSQAQACKSFSGLLAWLQATGLQQILTCTQRARRGPMASPGGVQGTILYEFIFIQRVLRT